MSTTTGVLNLPFDEALINLVREVVSSHATGIAGEDIVEQLVDRGHPINDATRALRFSIDHGTVSTGPGLLLYLP